MGFEDFLISTGVDGLINLIHERKKVEISDASRQLGIPTTTIENWAKTLEKEGLIKIDYNLTKQFLIWASLDSQEYAQKKEQNAIDRAQVSKKLEKLEKTVSQNLVELEDVKLQFEGKREDVEQKLGILSQDVRDATLLATQATQQIETKKNNLKQLEKELIDARKELSQFEEEIKNSPVTENQKKEGSEELMQKLDGACSSIEQKIANTSQEFEQIVDRLNTIARDLDGDDSSKMLEQIKSELDEVKFARNELVKSAKALLEEAKDMGERQSILSQRVLAIEKVRGQKFDPKKLKVEIEGIYEQAVKSSKEIMDQMQNDLLVVRKQIQDYSQATYKYQTISSRVQNIQNRYNVESSQLSALLTNLEQAQTKYANDLEDAKKMLGSNKEQFETLLNKAKQIDLMLSNVNDLKVEGEKLATHLKGLIREAQIVDMAAPTDARQMLKTQKSPVHMPVAQVRNKLENDSVIDDDIHTQEQYKQISDKITLTEQEERDFEKKREELRWLIHRMWEEDRAGEPQL